MNPLSTEFAVVDIETTGGKPGDSAITEIGVVVIKADEIVQEWSSLIRPSQPISPYVSHLTGITHDMVKNAPVFADISNELYNLLNERVFAAHHVNFDYAFIRAAFLSLGKNFNPPRICTMRAARKIFPKQNSYGLSSLTKSLGIELANHHRALPDARAAALILQKCIAQNADAIETMLKRNGGDDAMLPPFLSKEKYTKLPQKAGVYYLLNKAGEPLYIGKAINIKSRIRQHFSPSGISKTNPTAFREIYDIRFTLTGTELISLLLEAAEIRKYWPPLNRALKNPPLLYGPVIYRNRMDRRRVAINRLPKGDREHGSFGSIGQARRYLIDLAISNNLCLKCLAISPPLSETTLDECPQHRDEQHEALAGLLTDKQPDNQNFILAGQGRHGGEWSYILVTDGQYRGFGFIPGALNTEDPAIFQQHLIPQAHSAEADNILVSYLSGNFAETLLEINRLLFV